MWHRYLAISIFNIFAEFFVLVVILAFVLPQTTPSIVMQIVGWAIGVLVTVGCTFVALVHRTPERRDAIMLVAFHVACFILVYAGYGFLLSDAGAAVIVSPEIVVQLILESCAICLVAFHLRRRALQSMLGEGRVL
jgi:hypothetical protein